jgi:hypothetical protein
MSDLPNRQNPLKRLLAFIVCSKAISKKASPHKTGGEA